MPRDALMSSNKRFQVEFRKAVICSRLASLISVAMNGSTADLYVPTLKISISTPIFFSKSLKKMV